MLVAAAAGLGVRQIPRTLPERVAVLACRRRAYTRGSRLTNPAPRHVFREFQARMMDQLTEMRVFVRAIERGTFAAAASDQGLTPSAVSKLIRRLESRLGVRLINRTTRKLSLTSEGETYFHSGRRLIEAVDGLEDEVAASAGHPRGLLRINTEIWWGVQHLAPALIDFQQRYPDVRVSLSLTDRIVDLHAEQIDIAIRLGPLSDSNLMSRKLAEVDRVICASPQYVERFGFFPIVSAALVVSCSRSPQSHRSDRIRHRCALAGHHLNLPQLRDDLLRLVTLPHRGPPSGQLGHTSTRTTSLQAPQTSMSLPQRTRFLV